MSVLLGLLLGLAMAVPAAQPAHAAPPPGVPPVSARTTSVVTADALPTAQINGVVWTQVVVGDRVFAAGEFTRARPAGAAPGTQEQTRWNLLSYNLQTGALNNFAPQFNGPVKSLAVSPDGSTLYVGGSFTRVGSSTRNRFAAFRISNSALLTMHPNFNSTVEALAAGSTRVFAGGSFTTVDGQSRPRLAAVSAPSGAPLSWAPAADSTVRALTLTADRHKVIAGGRFQKVNGVDGRGLVALNATTGARQTWKMNTVVKDYGPNSAILSLAADGDTVYGTGYSFGGGNFEGVFAADDTIGEVRWINDCHGDTYGVTPVGDAIYSVGHPHFCTNIGGFPDMYPLAQRAMAMTKRVTGTVATNSAAEPLRQLRWPPRPVDLQLVPRSHPRHLHRQQPGGLERGRQCQLCRARWGVHRGERRRAAGPGPVHPAEPVDPSRPVRSTAVSARPRQFTPARLRARQWCGSRPTGTGTR